MRSKHTPILAAALAGLAFGCIHAGAALAQDGFQLPPSPGETGSVQGPVAEDVPPPRAPTPTPTPAPAPAPAPSPAETQGVEPEAGAPSVVAPIEIPPPSRPEAAVSPDAETASLGEVETEPDDPQSAEAGAGEADTGETTSGSAADRRAEPYPAQVPLGPASGPGAAAGDGGLAISWILIALMLLAAAGAGSALWWWRRESTGREVLIIPTIQRPRPVDRQLRAEPAPAPPPAAEQPEEEEEAGPVNPLRVALEPRQLRLSLVNATLSYRLMLTNSGDVPLTDIAISGDMISAHSSLPREQQIAGPDLPLEPIQTIDRLAPGESRTVRGEFRLPLPMIRPIRRGEMALFVPLARLSIAARGENGGSPTVITSVVGQIPPRGARGLQPFRLDLGPRTYSELSQRAFA